MKIASKRIFFVVVFYSFFALGCEYENKEDLMKTYGCDTMNVSYLSVIQPILKDNCYQCHNQISKTAGFNIEDKEEIKLRMKSGLLQGAINRKTGYPQMPYLMPKLDDCTIKKIEAWQNAGFPD